MCVGTRQREGGEGRASHPQRRLLLGVKCGDPRLQLARMLQRGLLAAQGGVLARAQLSLCSTRSILHLCRPALQARLPLGEQALALGDLANSLCLELGLARVQPLLAL